MKQVELTDGVIAMRPFRPEDAESHLAGEDEEQIRWLSGGKSTLASVRSWIESNEKSWEDGGPVFNFAIWSLADQNLVGMAEANTANLGIEGLESGDANISYGIYPRARGKGYATRAVNLLLQFLKSKKFKRAVIRIDPRNTYSVTVPIACGFRATGDIVHTEQGELAVYLKEL